jgi:hypothetical protein
MTSAACNAVLETSRNVEDDMEQPETEREQREREAREAREQEKAAREGNAGDGEDQDDGDDKGEPDDDVREAYGTGPAAGDAGEGDAGDT